MTEQTSGNRAFFGPAPGQIADLRLVTPPIQVGTNAFSVSFRHMHDFERSDGQNWDGAIVELSTDDGATWTQVPQSAFASSGGYNGTISNESENPLGTLQGFSGRSTGWPTTFKTDTMSFGTTYQGQTVRLRFRIGTDQAQAGGGWLIDDVAITGATVPPFSTVVDEDAVCAVVNYPPVVDAGDDFAADEQGAVVLAGAASDPTGETITLTWTQVSGTPVTLTAADSLTPGFTAPEVAQDTVLTFELSATDGELSATDTVNVTIRNVNHAPTASAGSDQTVDPGATVTLQGSGTDPDGDALTFTWTQTSGATVDLAVLADGAVSFTAPSTDVEASLVFSLVVSDGELQSEPAQITVTVRGVQPVDALTVEAGPDQTVASGASVTLSAAIAGGQGAPNVTWTQASGPSVTLTGAGATGTTFTAPSVTADTDLVFTVTATDATGSASDSLTVRVKKAESTTPPPPASGCGCGAGSSAFGALLPLVLIGLAGMRRRRRS